MWAKALQTIQPTKAVTVPQKGPMSHVGLYNDLLDWLEHMIMEMNAKPRG